MLLLHPTPGSHGPSQKIIDAEVSFSGRMEKAFMFVNTNICALMNAGVYVS